MKKLSLLRHAQSDWSYGQSDFDRSINELWKISIEKMGKYLLQKNISPDMIIASPALRAKTTIEWMVPYLNYHQDNIVYMQEIYDTHIEWYEWALACVMEQDDQIETLFFVGHNYAITELAEFLVWKDVWSMPAGSMVTLCFDVEKWKDISYGNGTLESFIKPKEL